MIDPPYNHFCRICDNYVEPFDDLTDMFFLLLLFIFFIQGVQVSLLNGPINMKLAFQEAWNLLFKKTENIWS